MAILLPFMCMTQACLQLSVTALWSKVTLKHTQQKHFSCSDSPGTSTATTLRCVYKPVCSATSSGRNHMGPVLAAGCHESSSGVCRTSPLDSMAGCSQAESSRGKTSCTQLTEAGLGCHACCCGSCLSQQVCYAKPALLERSPVLCKPC